MNKKIQLLSSKFERLNASEFISFDQVASLKNVMGVYMIYNESKELLYIGNTNKFHIRFGTDLKHESTHTLVRKMIKKEMFSDRHKVVDFLKNKCSIKIEVCETKREAEALEHIAIYILNPLLNK
jgi:excinuclease UvrABC nuclease subunit